jgi:hypothetical protein
MTDQTIRMGSGSWQVASGAGHWVADTDTGTATEGTQVSDNHASEAMVNAAMAAGAGETSADQDNDSGARSAWVIDASNGGFSATWYDAEGTGMVSLWRPTWPALLTHLAVKYNADGTRYERIA